MIEFKDTYLYIKKHKITGLMYFGKTIGNNPLKYLGSGTYWKNHIKKYGIENVETIWFEKFTNENDLVEFALFFSEFHSIVKSKLWANKIPENGLTGGIIGKRSEEFCHTISESHWAKNLPRELNPNTGSKRSKETCENISKAKIGKPTKLRGYKRSKEARDFLSKLRKGIFSRSQEKIKLLVIKQNEILKFYESKPELIYGTIQRNGMLLTYERAFSNKYAELFGLSSTGLHNIITGKSNVRKHLNDTNI